MFHRCYRAERRAEVSTWWCYQQRADVCRRAGTWGFNYRSNMISCKGEKTAVISQSLLQNPWALQNWLYIGNSSYLLGATKEKPGNSSSWFTVKNLTFLGNLENGNSGTRVHFVNLPKGEMKILVIEKGRRKRFPFWSQTNRHMFLEPLFPCGLSSSRGWSEFVHMAISGPQEGARPWEAQHLPFTECHPWLIFLVKASYGFTSSWEVLLKKGAYRETSSLSLKSTIPPWGAKQSVPFFPLLLHFLTF